MKALKCIFCDSVLDKTGYYCYKCKRCSHNYLGIYFTFDESKLEAVHFYGKKYCALI
jgi:phage FluMu protein Com